MKPTTRIIANTLAQHIRSIINICLSLYSTRLVLKALGQSDYGIFSLVAGVVALLGFLTNAMVVTTQRQLSFYHGKGNPEDVRAMFSNCLLLHFIIGLIIAAALFLIEPYLFNGFLKIDPDRTGTAVHIYFVTVLTLFITFITAPYRAMFIAREEIIFISIVDVIDGVLKLLFAICLLSLNTDRLISYTWALCGIMAFNYVALASWAMTHFNECLIIPKRKYYNRTFQKDLTDFAGWTVYSMGCIIARAQGTAVILNRFFGTIINSSYGIAHQVFSAILFIAQAVTNAMSPQIVKAESCNDRQRMLRLSEISSKYAVLLLSVVVVPLVFEMPEVLETWLGDVPPNAVLISRFLLLTTLCDQLTIGLGTANQAIGRIRNYSICVNTIKVMTLPAFWLCLRLGYSLVWAMWIYMGFELLCAMVRLPFLKFTAGLSIRHFALHVFARVIPSFIILVVVCWLMVTFVQMPFRFLLTGVVAVISTTISVWLTALESSEKALVTSLFENIPFHHK